MKNSSRHGKAAFTLIELMAVITIIVILAGLVVGGLSFVNDRQAKDKAKVQIALISKALEEYKLENGTYPPTADTETGTGQSDVLFNALYWDSNNDGKGAATGSDAGDTDQKIYLAELNPTSSKDAKSSSQGWTSGTPSAKTKIVDPWGNEYRYRTAYGAAPAGGGTAPPNNSTQNPDFDLWSAGKDGQSKPGSKADKTNLDDIKNF